MTKVDVSIFWTRRIVDPTSGCSNKLSRPDFFQINQHLYSTTWMWNNYQLHTYHRFWESWTDPRKAEKMWPYSTRGSGPSAGPWTTLLCPAMGSSEGCLIDRVSLESDSWPTDVHDPTDYSKKKVWRTSTDTRESRAAISDIWRHGYEYRCTYYN